MLHNLKYLRLMLKNLNIEICIRPIFVEQTLQSLYTNATRLLRMRLGEIELK